MVPCNGDRSNQNSALIEAFEREKKGEIAGFSQHDEALFEVLEQRSNVLENEGAEEYTGSDLPLSVSSFEN